MTPFFCLGRLVSRLNEFRIRKSKPNAATPPGHSHSLASKNISLTKSLSRRNACVWRGTAWFELSTVCAEVHSKPPRISSSSLGLQQQRTKSLWACMIKKHSFFSLPFLACALEAALQSITTLCSTIAMEPNQSDSPDVTLSESHGCHSWLVRLWFMKPFFLHWIECAISEHLPTFVGARCPKQRLSCSF